MVIDEDEDDDSDLIICTPEPVTEHTQDVSGALSPCASTLLSTRQLTMDQAEQSLAAYRAAMKKVEEINQLLLTRPSYRPGAASSSQEIQTAVRLILPSEVAKQTRTHAHRTEEEGKKKDE